MNVGEEHLKDLATKQTGDEKRAPCLKPKRSDHSLLLCFTLVVFNNMKTWLQVVILSCWL